MSKPQDEKSNTHINLQPKNIETENIQAIMMHELCGRRNGEIATLVGMTDSRVSIIRNSPLYKSQLALRREELKDEIIDKKSTQVTEDPVYKHLQGVKLGAAEKLSEKMIGAKNEFLQVACAKDILDRTGYVAEKRVTTKTIEVTDAMAERFEQAITYRETRTRTTGNKVGE